MQIRWFWTALMGRLSELDNVRQMDECCCCGPVFQPPHTHECYSVSHIFGGGVLCSRHRICRCNQLLSVDAPQNSLRMTYEHTNKRGEVGGKLFRTNSTKSSLQQLKGGREARQGADRD